MGRLDRSDYLWYKFYCGYLATGERIAFNQQNRRW
jgi:hypothetical protein